MSKSTALICAVVGACVVGLAQKPVAAEQPKQRNDGVSSICGTFVVQADLWLFTVDLDQRVDEGWAYVSPSRKIVEATGVAHNIRVASNDTPANHKSHDLDFGIILDPEQEDLLSNQPNDILGVEWETGIDVSEKYGDGANPIFPKWAWPSEGDRVWVNGNWIHDCGHPNEQTGLYTTEIHPARAVASMRDQAAPIPGSGLTPVPVTLTDLYISGNGGFTPNQLNCGPDIVLDDYGATCGQNPPPADDSYKTTPINDTDFGFDVCLPPRPANAGFSYQVVNGPRNTVSIAPKIDLVAADGACLNNPRYDASKMMRVTVPLNGTATPPMAVYARHIYAGWVTPPDPVLPHRLVTLDSTYLHNDHDTDPGDGELSFWWMNIDRAEREWIRLNDHATQSMHPYDDHKLVGDGMRYFNGATFDFYLRHDETFTVQSVGYEQDCYDLLLGGAYFGHHRIEVPMYLICKAAVFDYQAGDPIDKASTAFTAEDLGTRPVFGGDDYDLGITIAEVPLGLEDTSHLSIHTMCIPEDEVALVGRKVTCGTAVHNAGVGLPRKVEITNKFSGAPAPVVKSAAWSIPGPLGTPSTSTGCSVGSDARCKPTTVLVALRTPTNMATVVEPTAPGMMTERAEVTTASDDPDLNDNVKTTTIEVFQQVTVDVSPRNTVNEINLGRGGTVSVAILTTADFNATSVDPLSICFGDGDMPSQRTCTEQHGGGHLEDVNGDKKLDLLLHFDVAATGIDLNDTNACLLGRTKTGTGIYGCDTITTRPQ